MLSQTGEHRLARLFLSRNVPVKILKGHYFPDHLHNITWQATLCASLCEISQSLPETCIPKKNMHERCHSLGRERATYYDTL